MSGILADFWIDYDRTPDIAPNGEIGVKVTIYNKFRSQKHFELRFILPDGWTVSGKTNLQAKPVGNRPSVGEYIIKAGDKVSAKNRIILEITCEGHSDTTLIPMVFFG